MFDDINLVQIVIQGGSVGVAVLALGIMYQLLRAGARIMDNHLVHITTVLTQLVEKLDRLVDATERRNGDYRGRTD